MRNQKERITKSEAKKRKVHTPEFKTKVGLEALRGQKSINEIVQEYGVHPVMVGQWKKEIQDQAKTLLYSRRVLIWRISNSTEAAFCGIAWRIRQLNPCPARVHGQ